MNSLALRWLRRLVFPMVFGGVGLLAWHGYAPGTASWLMPLLIVGAGAIVFALERIIPYERAWNAGDGTRDNVAYLAITQVSVLAADAVVWGGVAMLVSPLVASSLGEFWPTGWPVVVQIVVAMIAADFLPYLYHRASHESSGVLWRIHAIHHYPDRLYTLNFAQFHPINAFLTAALTLLPLALFGVPAEVIFVVAALHNIHGVMSHANVDFRLGPLNAIFSMAQVHRWHHARDIRVANSNYGATLLVWDWLYGTRRHPRERLAADAVGVSSTVTPPRGIGAQLCHPFVAHIDPSPTGWHCLRALLS